MQLKYAFYSLGSRRWLVIITPFLAFTNRCAAAFSSSGSVLSTLSSSLSSSQSELALGTTDVEAVTEALVGAVKYNMQRKCLPTWVVLLLNINFPKCVTCQFEAV